MREQATAAVAVVVPAHNEERLVGPCLRALARAADRCPLPVRLVVVLDACTDGTGSRVRRVARRDPRIDVVAVDARRVGVAREAGARRALALFPDVAPARLWLAGTDADSAVPPDWLDHQVRLADAGADLVLGLVTLAEAPPGQDAATHAVWALRYRQRIAGGRHGHVHGANLGVRASVLAAAGGWPPVAAHDDRDLVRAARRAGAAVVTTTAAPVRTSARTVGRAPDGVAADLAGLRPTGASHPPG